MQILEELDENNLRRTNSEPNLKVKSALKDRLLEKRNLLNPFLAIKKGGQHQQKQQQQIQTNTNNNNNNNNSFLNTQNKNNLLSKLSTNINMNSSSSSSSKKTLSPSCSMSSIPTLSNTSHIPPSSFNNSSLSVPTPLQLSSSSLSALPLSSHHTFLELNTENKRVRH